MTLARMIWSRRLERETWRRKKRKTGYVILSLIRLPDAETDPPDVGMKMRFWLLLRNRRLFSSTTMSIMIPDTAIKTDRYRCATVDLHEISPNDAVLHEPNFQSWLKGKILSTACDTLFKLSDRFSCFQMQRLTGRHRKSEEYGSKFL